MNMLYLLAFFLFIGLVVVQEIFRRFPKFALLFWVAVPVILYACWLLLWQQPDWFPWVKVFSIEIGVLTLSWYRLGTLGKNRIGRWVIYFFLAANIFEAVFRDVVSGGLANYLNAIAGVLLVLTLEKIGSIHIDTKTKYRDLSWGGMTFAWIVGYTIWNWTFVSLNYGVSSSIVHFAVLAAPFVVACIDRERWLQARVFTLASYFVIFHTVPHLNPDRQPSNFNETAGLSLAYASFLFMALYAFSYYRRQSLTTGSNKICIR